MVVTMGPVIMSQIQYGSLCGSYKVANDSVAVQCKSANEGSD